MPVEYHPATQAMQDWANRITPEPTPVRRDPEAVAEQVPVAAAAAVVEASQVVARPNGV
jgi:hypothetical protein